MRKLQAPSSKLQRSVEKLQAPRSKLQRSTKRQAPNPRARPTVPLNYSEVETAGLRVQETPDGNGAGRHPFDLEERTAVFGEEVVRFARNIPRHPANDRLVGQVAGCGTSIGANYCEANEAVSKKDFRCSIGRCVKEAKETKFFLRMIAAAEPASAAEARRLYREAKELHLIFATMFRR